MITIHQRHRRTDRQTTCDRNTALCTKVHRAVKTGNSRGVIAVNIKDSFEWESFQVVLHEYSKEEKYGTEVGN